MRGFLICHVKLCYVVICYVMLCYVMLCYIRRNVIAVQILSVGRNVTKIKTRYGSANPFSKMKSNINEDTLWQCKFSQQNEI